MSRPIPQDPLCHHHLPLDECPWCAPSRVVQEAPPHLLADLGAEHLGGESAFHAGVAYHIGPDGRIQLTGISLSPGPRDTDEATGHV